MAFDALTLAAVKHEVEREVVGGHVQRVVQTGALAIGLEVYAHRRRQFLVCSAEPETARICLAADRPVRDADTPTPFLLLLRKYVRDGRISGLEQPPLERILRLRVQKRVDSGQLVEVDLIIEVMGRRSNVLLVDAHGQILDALKRSGPTRNPLRPVLPNRPYVYPPTQDRFDPRLDSSYEKLASAASTDRLEHFLAANLAGFSPLAARELAYRSDGLGRSAAQADWGRVRMAAAELLSPLESGRWQPSTARSAQGSLVFAPYPLGHLGAGDQPHLASISAAVEQSLSAGPDVRPAAPPANRALLREIESLRARAVRRISALGRARDAALQAERLRLEGEAVLANLTLIEQGQTVLDFDGQQVDLDTSQSPLENAQRLFDEYRRARDAGRQVPELLTAAELEVQQLDELQVLVEIADSPARLRAIAAELAELNAGRLQTESNAKPARHERRPRQPEGQLLRRRTLEGLEVLVGTSSRGNAAVTFRLAGPDDLWLHARGVPGAHVILRTAGRQPEPESLLFAALLAARNSQARFAGNVEVDYTARRHVRKIPAGPPGQVTYRAEQTIRVQLDRPDHGPGTMLDQAERPLASSN